MAKFTKFGLSSSGELVYRSSGRLAPSSYTVRGSTVYGKDGRKVGQIGKGTAKEQRTIRNASTRRREGSRALYKAPHKVATVKGKGKIREVFEDINKARRQARRRNVQGPVRPTSMMFDSSQMANLEKSVKSMAKLSAGDDWYLREKIDGMTKENLTMLYNDPNGELVFEVYFDYGSIGSGKKGLTPTDESKKNAKLLVDAYERKFGKIPVQGRLEA